MNTTINSKRVAATPMTATGMTATEVAAGRTPLRASGGVYDEEDVRLYGTVPAAGHNPNGLTVAQVGAGFRLLAPEEIPPPDSRAYPEGIQRWIAPNWDGSKWRGTDAAGTFRTRKPPGFFLPAAAKVAVDIPALDVRRYVHTFVCNACPRTCTMETVAAEPHLSALPIDMLCPFRLSDAGGERRTEFIAIWKAGLVQTLT